jgi:hypothetical protein
VEVGSLDLPASDDAARVAASGAGTLFVERAQYVATRVSDQRGRNSPSFPRRRRPDASFRPCGGDRQVVDAGG